MTSFDCYTDAGPMVVLILGWVLFGLSELLGVIPEKYIKACGFLDFLVNILKNIRVQPQTVQQQAQSQLQLDFNAFREYLQRPEFIRATATATHQAQEMGVQTGA